MRYSIVNYSQVKNSPDLRIDSDYWHPAFIQNALLFSSQQKIGDLVDHNVQNIKSSPINRTFEYLEISGISLNGCEYQSTRVEPGNEPDRAHHILQKGDVAVSTVRPNRNAVAFIQKDGIVGSSGLAVLRTKKVEPEYLFAFCKTDYFVKCLMRANKASMYPAVSKKDVLETPFFAASDNFRSGIALLVKGALYENQKANASFDSAQSLLLAELGLTDWRPKHQSTFIKNYSDIQAANRIDAEYHQPKYDEIVNAVQDCSGGWDTLGNLVNLKAKNYRPKSEQEYKYIELANVRGNGEVVDCMSEEGQNLPTRARCRVSTGDVIVSSIEGSLDSVALIDKEYDQALCSTGFHVVNSLVLNSETLLVILKSMIGQLQLKKGCSGTILTAINKDEFTKIALPKIKEGIQTEIQQKALESFNLKRQSKRLLECAKRAVETAIEQDERRAIEWLDRTALI